MAAQTKLELLHELLEPQPIGCRLSPFEDLMKSAVMALLDAEIARSKCCGGGPQWGHAIDCPKCPD